MQYPFDIFFSYSHKDLNRARFIVNKLREIGFKIWFAEEQLPPGSRFRSHLEQGIRESQHLVSFITDSYVKRSWTQREVDLFDLKASAQDRRILGLETNEFSKANFDILDQVFKVHQRIKWKNKNVDYTALWHLYCGILSKGPGIKSDWVNNGKSLLGRNKLKKSIPTKEQKDSRSTLAYNLDVTDINYEVNFKNLKGYLRQINPIRIDEMIRNYWAEGKPDYGLLLTLGSSLTRESAYEYRIWCCVDLGLQDLANKLISFKSLIGHQQSEVISRGLFRNSNGTIFNLRLN